MEATPTENDQTVQCSLCRVEAHQHSVSPCHHSARLSILQARSKTTIMETLDGKHVMGTSVRTAKRLNHDLLYHQSTDLYDCKLKGVLEYMTILPLLFSELLLEQLSYSS